MWRAGQGKLNLEISVYLKMHYTADENYEIFPIIMSHSLLWRHIVLLTVGVYSSNHKVLSTIGISMTRRFQKSVGPSVYPFVTLTKKAYSSFIIDSRKIIRISDEKVWHPLQENEAIFSEK